MDVLTIYGTVLRVKHHTYRNGSHRLALRFYPNVRLMEKMQREAESDAEWREAFEAWECDDR